MTDSKALIKRLRFCWLTLTRDEIQQAADHIENLEADNARLREALEGIKAAVDDLDNPFDASASGEMHYGFERAVDDATLVIEAALQENGQ